MSDVGFSTWRRPGGAGDSEGLSSALLRLSSESGQVGKLENLWAGWTVQLKATV